METGNMKRTPCPTLSSENSRERKWRAGRGATTSLVRRDPPFDSAKHSRISYLNLEQRKVTVAFLEKGVIVGVSAFCRHETPTKVLREDVLCPSSCLVFLMLLMALYS